VEFLQRIGEGITFQSKNTGLAQALNEVIGKRPSPADSDRVGSMRTDLQVNTAAALLVSMERQKSQDRWTAVFTGASAGGSALLGWAVDKYVVENILNHKFGEGFKKEDLSSPDK
jgi:hypothetical protein